MKHKEVQIVAVELQSSLIEQSRTTEVAVMTRAAVALCEVAEILAVPITFNVVPEKDKPGRLLPALERFARNGNVFPRHSASAFLSEETKAALAAHGRKSLVVCGFAAEVAVLYTALDGLAEGYAVQVPVDCIGGHSARTEDAALRQIEAKGGGTTCVMSLIAGLAPEFSASPGTLIMQRIKALAEPLS